MSHWAARYIGRPWVPDAEGPAAFNCWSFFRHVQARHYGRDLPAIANPGALLPQARAVRDHPERQRWARVETPADGDAVLMAPGRHPIHVGVWVDADGGRVVHCFEGSGVVAQSLADLAANRWRVDGFYRFIGGVQ